jgi:phosphate transport system substrate-binding protein
MVGRPFRMRTRSISAALVGAVISMGTCLAAAELRIVGTDLLGTDFSRALYDCGARHHLPVVVALDGSRPAIAELESNRADMGIVVWPAEVQRPAVGYESIVLGYRIVVVLVPADSPIRELNLPQVAAIFGTGQPVSINRSSELGFAEQGEGPLRLLVPSIGSGTGEEYFRHAVLGGNALKAHVARYRSESELVSRLTTESQAIALAEGISCATGTRCLALAAEASQPAFLPTSENIHAGQYPLRLPIHLVFRTDRRANAEPLIEFLTSAAAASLLARENIVAAPATSHSNGSPPAPQSETQTRK